jgi:hypothetical protein
MSKGISSIQEAENIKEGKNKDGVFTRKQSTISTHNIVKPMEQMTEEEKAAEIERVKNMFSKNDKPEPVKDKEVTLEDAVDSFVDKITPHLLNQDDIDYAVKQINYHIGNLKKIIKNGSEEKEKEKESMKEKENKNNAK